MLARVSWQLTFLGIGHLAPRTWTKSNLLIIVQFKDQINSKDNKSNGKYVKSDQPYVIKLKDFKRYKKYQVR